MSGRDEDVLAWHALNTELVGCRACARLVTWREQVAREKRRAYRDQVYWGRPVPGFGDRSARLLIVGLAPGAHGSNRTGRMFILITRMAALDPSASGPDVRADRL